MLFLTIIILGVISLQSSNLAMINSQNNEIQAHFYANQGIAIVEAVGYEDLLAAGCTICEILPPAPDYGVEEWDGVSEKIAGLFERKFNLNGTLPDAYQVTMDVEWEDSTGDHKISAKRIISK